MSRFAKSSELKLKFLVTSRPYEDLEKSFKKFPATAAYLHFDGEDKSEQIGREIDLVVDARVPDITAGFDADDQRKISERLKSMEHRTYLWLHLTFDIIERSPSIYGKRSDVEDLLRNLPSDVAEAYEKILRRNETGSTAQNYPSFIRRQESFSFILNDKVNGKGA
ncbi:hypothetical protein QQX98_009189 [Neonectria punicea]|uniref:DUF7069 domain-containing protein n=1 Tax=Neonectria punicea TaxID=979145 RepID=A0ABR1GTA7_9HYPO